MLVRDDDTESMLVRDDDTASHHRPCT